MAIAGCGEVIGIASSIRVARVNFRFLEVVLWPPLMDHSECSMERFRQVILSTYS
jgi:hypothetical protein